MNGEPDLHYDAPHDIGNKYLQWRLREEKMEAHWDVSQLPNCLHCDGTAPCTDKLCVNCVRAFQKTVQ